MVAPVDPFDLPEWLGVEAVTWRGGTSTDGRSHLVRGTLTSATAELPCDVLAGDLAFPRPVLEERWRCDAHAAWLRDEVLTLEQDGRLTLAAPGSSVDAALVLEAVRRLAKAVGSAPERFTVALRL
ncbi:hypothetical protein [Nocardioides caldifontis]|uniref:hypothetical protein n=1 Tax=Nocardioides caldifontis TaxID=2588938 RepID=UPI0011DF7243|nr:hypothetical protein [Nocardioides caldifontis]